MGLMRRKALDCPGKCRASGASAYNQAPHHGFRIMESERALLDELYFYTLAHQDPRFIHQHVVDAYAAQNAVEHSKPIGVAFALFGLYLHLEKGYTGRQVQAAHMQLAKKRTKWPSFELPATRGDVTVADVMAAPAGAERDDAIERWCASVWKAWSASHDEIARLLNTELGGH